MDAARQATNATLVKVIVMTTAIAKVWARADTTTVPGVPPTTAV